MWGDVGRCGAGAELPQGRRGVAAADREEAGVARGGEAARGGHVRADRGAGLDSRAVVQPEGPGRGSGCEQAGSLAGGDKEGALLAQTCAAFFLLLEGRDAHPLAHATAYLPAACPLGGGGGGEGGGEGGVAALEPALPSLEPSLLRDAGLPYLSLYKSKAALWGGYLLAQWGVARALSLDETATMAQEARGPRAESRELTRDGPRWPRWPEVARDGPRWRKRRAASELTRDGPAWLVHNPSVLHRERVP